MREKCFIYIYHNKCVMQRYKDMCVSLYINVHTHIHYTHTHEEKIVLGENYPASILVFFSHFILVNLLFQITLVFYMR